MSRGGAPLFLFDAHPSKHGGGEEQAIDEGQEGLQEEDVSLARKRRAFVVCLYGLVEVERHGGLDGVGLIFCVCDLQCGPFHEEGLVRREGSGSIPDQKHRPDSSHENAGQE